MELNVAEHAVSELNPTTCLIAAGWLERDIDPENSMLCQCLISFQIRHSPPRLYVPWTLVNMWWSPSKSFSTEPPAQQLGSLITNGRKIRDRIGYVERLCGKYDIDIGMEGEVRMEYSAEMIELTKNVTY